MSTHQAWSPHTDPEKRLQAEDAREPRLPGKRAIFATSAALGDGNIGEHCLDVAPAAGVARTTTRGAIDAAAHDARRIPDPRRACKSLGGEAPTIIDSSSCEA